MASGKNEFLVAGPPERMRGAEWAELFFSDAMKVPAGSQFFYSNACTYMLGRVVEKVSGQTLRDFLVPRLFDPLGIDNPQWHSCPRGHSVAATDLFLTNAEYSRLGRLLLDGGTYEGQRVVSQAWVKEMQTEVIDNSSWEEPESKLGYGYQVWRCTPPGAFRADGMYGQFSVVFPDKQAVVTVTAHEEKKQNDLLRLVYRDVLPQLG
jgi:CubicO group peptidase (beta-lactamase class C family)